MSRAIGITPHGRLVAAAFADPDYSSLQESDAAACDAAFENSSAQGLLWLASRRGDAKLSPTLAFWKEFSERFFHAICHFGDEAGVERKWRQLDPPDDGDLDAIILSAPPMRGLEYLSTESLVRLWHELQELVVEQAKLHPDGPKGLLREINPIWHLLGRVTFNLAENKRDTDRPFAFLATYTRRISAAGRLQHVPLGEALKEYAGEKNNSRLTALLEPVKLAAEGSTLVRGLLESRELFQAQAWSIRQAHRFLLETAQLESAGLVVRVPDWWNARQPTRPQVQVRIGQSETSQLGMDSLLDFSTELALDGEPLSAIEREQLLQATEGLILLRGRWVEVDRQRLQEALNHWHQLESLHPDGMSFIQGMRLLAGASLDGETKEQSTADWSQVVAGKWLHDTLQALRQPTGITALRPGVDLQATLRPYQADGVRWLWFMTRLGLGACLADDMGLGKTIQVIDLLLQMKRESSQNGPGRGKSQTASDGATASLLVIPASLIGNWKQEIERFAPSLRVFYAHPSECDVDELKRAAKEPKKSLAGFDLVVTTYGLARRNEWLRAISWRLIVLDEAQAIKNASSTQTKTVKQIAASSRIALTGTPVENNLGDLWSIFDFCCPGLLGSAAQFKRFIKQLGDAKDTAAFGALRRLVQPYLLRRLKTDPNVVPDLPEKTEMRIECGLSQKQAVFYERAVADLAERLKNAEGIARRGLVLSVLMQLKQICNHPAQYLNQSEFPPGDSGKFGRLESICESIAGRQEKVLVFTQFQTLCEPLANYLTGMFGRPGLTLSGKTAVRQRAQRVRQFQEDDGPPFFVISLKAGGSGLNLTAASHVVHFDRWWNPAVENQATDRAFRIGQQRNVFVHKFVCRGTVEERIDSMLRDKQGMADKLLAPGGETLLTEMADEELLQFVAIDLNRASAEL